MTTHTTMTTTDIDPTDCELCGERFDLGYPEAEMYDTETGHHVLCHAECGLGHGYEVA